VAKLRSKFRNQMFVRKLKSLQKNGLFYEKEFKLDEN